MRSFANSSRDLNFHLLLALESAHAPALGAGAFYNATRATTGLAGSSYGKESLLITDLTGSAAIAAILRLSTGGGPVAFARFTGFQSGDAQLRGHTVVGFFECDLEIVTKVSTALRCRTASPCARSAKDIIKPK